MIERDLSEIKTQLEKNMIQLPKHLRSITSNMLITGIALNQNLASSDPTSKAPFLTLKCKKAPLNFSIPYYCDKDKLNRRKLTQKERKVCSRNEDKFQKIMEINKEKFPIKPKKGNYFQFSPSQTCHAYLSRSLSAKFKHINYSFTPNKTTQSSSWKTQNSEDTFRPDSSDGICSEFFKTKCKLSLKTRLYRIFEQSKNEDNGFYSTNLSIKSFQLPRKKVKSTQSKPSRVQTVLINDHSDPCIGAKNQELKPWAIDWTDKMQEQTREEWLNNLESQKL